MTVSPSARCMFLYRAGALLITVTLVRGMVAYGQSYLTAHLAQHLAYRLRHLLYDQIQRLSFAYHDRAQTGELMSRATADVEAVRLFFQFGWPIGLSVALAGTGTIVADGLARLAPGGSDAGQSAVLSRRDSRNRPVPASSTTVGAGENR